MALMVDDFAGTDTALAMLSVRGAGLAAEAIAMAIDAGPPRLIIYVDHGELANSPIVVGDLTSAISGGVGTYSSASTGTHTEPAPPQASQQTDPRLTMQKAADVAKRCQETATSLRAVLATHWQRWHLLTPETLVCNDSDYGLQLALMLGQISAGPKKLPQACSCQRTSPSQQLGSHRHIAKSVD